MLYLELLKKQIDEYSEKIIHLKDCIKSNKDPIKTNILLMQIDHAEIHKNCLNKLMINFKEAV